MREDLLGFLLGALEPDEERRIVEALLRDPDLRAELERLRESLRPLQQSEEVFEPPADLVFKTMSGIPERIVENEPFVGAETSVGDTGAGDAGATGEEKQPKNAVSGLSPMPVPATSSPWRWMDAFATVAATTVLAGLVLPGILRERASSRSVACQEQLRTAGTALFEFLTHSTDSRFPQLEVDGPEAFAGRYATALAEAGLISFERPLWCPSLDIPVAWQHRPLPSHAELHQASPAHLAFLQEGAGGHYAYSLGVRDQGRYFAPRFESRPYFAILADSPLDRFSGSGEAHEGRGFNILFEDGHVAFAAQPNAFDWGDHPFLNRSGEVEAGVDRNDAILAPSPMPPFALIRNR